MGSFYESTDTTYFYDIASNTWTDGPAMGSRRVAHVQAMLPDGRVFVYGGGVFTRAATL